MSGEDEGSTAVKGLQLAGNAVDRTAAENDPSHERAMVERFHAYSDVRCRLD
jgi:hypothetical protein